MTTLTRKRRNARGQFKSGDNQPTVTRTMLKQYQAYIDTQTTKTNAHIANMVACKPSAGIALSVTYDDIFSNEVTEIMLFEDYCQWVQSALSPKLWYADWVTLADLNMVEEPPAYEAINDMGRELDCMMKGWENDNGYIGDMN